MSLLLLASALGLLCAGAVGAATLRSGLRALRIGAILGSSACALGAAASVGFLVSSAQHTFRLTWSPPINSLSFGIDPLSAFFLLCIFAVGGLALLYSLGYFAAVAAQRAVGSALGWLQGLIVAMAMVVLARDGISFLVAWEVMFVASYFLVTFDDHEAHVRAAGFTYLIASHISVVLLFILFGLLMREGGSRDFAALAAAPLSGTHASLCFGVALAGFGIKAGVWPLHGWLPEAHPAAPSPVSALMSGAMIKMGIYGMLRTLTFLGPPPVAWGLTLLVVGALSALAGVLLAVAQSDLKRLLAYSSVENIGIIILGIGIGGLGEAANAPAIAFAGFGGALLHTLNHGLFKGVLFQAVGVVAHATGSRDMESHGGLLRRMPATGALFLVGAVAISGLPPLNGFAGEWLIYMGALRHGVLDHAPGASGMALVVVPVLAVVGGLAAACFVKAFGVAFLGEPRSAATAQAHDSGGAMRIAMTLGAAACCAIGVAPAVALRLVAGAASQLAGAESASAVVTFASLTTISLVAALLSAGIISLVILGRQLLRGRDVHAADTWSCGYALPMPRMQYTGASFAALVLEPFQGLFHVRTHRAPVAGLFPQHASEDIQFADPGEAAVSWIVAAAVVQLTRLRALQRGPVQLYLLYVLVTLLALLIWQVQT